LYLEKRGKKGVKVASDGKIVLDKDVLMST
jgi:hypothetical protein